MGVFQELKNEIKQLQKNQSGREYPPGYFPR